MQSVSAPTSRHLAGQGLGGRLLIDHAAAQPRTGISAPLPAGEGKARGPKGPDVSPPCGPSTAFTKAASLGPRDPTDPLGRHCVCRTRPCWRTADASPGDKRGPPGARGTPDLDPNPRHLPGRPGPSARHRLDGGARYAQVVPDPPLRSLDFAPQAPRRALRGSRALLQAPWLVNPQPWARCRAAHAVSPGACAHLRCPRLPSPCRGADVAPPMARALPPAHPSSRAGCPCPSSPFCLITARLAASQLLLAARSAAWLTMSRLCLHSGRLGPGPRHSDSGASGPFLSVRLPSCIGLPAFRCGKARPAPSRTSAKYLAVQPSSCPAPLRIPCLSFEFVDADLPDIVAADAASPSNLPTPLLSPRTASGRPAGGWCRPAVG